KTKKRNKELMSKSLISEHEVDKLNTDIRIAELNLTLEQENKRIAEIANQRANALLQRRVVKSPITGFVMERYKSVGERSSDDPIVRIAQLDPLHVEVIIPAQHFNKVHEGMHAKVVNKPAGSSPYKAVVERVDKVLDAASGTFGVRLSVSNPGHKRPAGVLCTLNFLTQD
ncbi:MAG: efflux RND transporter periplasmic adaptor subunit, partial [Granulosicoccaceae bacterium]